MSINLDERYPGRANGKTLSYPQGSFKNRTSPTSKDGTYLEQDWANDQLAFFQSLMKDAGMTANGAVDTVEASQYFDALRSVIESSQTGIPGATFAEISALTEDRGPIICTDQDGILYAWEPGANKYVAQAADNETALAKSSPANLLTPSGLGFSLQPHIEASATFTRSSNQIVLTGIVPNLALEVGDVIEITGSADNNRLHTVESIADDDTIIVNYEHRNGAGSLSLVEETTNMTIKRIAKWYNAPIGLGQAWVDVTAQRATGTIYTNTTGRTITVIINTATGSGLHAEVDGFSVYSNYTTGSSLSRGSLTMVVPPGSTYQLIVGGGNLTWGELR